MPYIKAKVGFNDNMDRHYMVVYCAYMCKNILYIKNITNELVM